MLKSSLPLSHKSDKHICLEQESRHMVFAGTVVLSSTGSGEDEGLWAGKRGETEREALRDQQEEGGERGTDDAPC